MLLFALGSAGDGLVPVEPRVHSDVIRPVSSQPASPLDKPVPASLLAGPVAASETVLDGQSCNNGSSVLGGLVGKIRPPIPEDIFRPPRSSH
ncbi:MAG: hypothetical protein GYA21_13630 [Myxococcales bacterium]|nr:hypothetical protein [Myxococcales bacterium]